MAENYLITGYWGEPHVTAENDRGINAAIFGTGRFVLPVGEKFKAEYIGNNTVRVYDGKLLDNGAAAGIPAGEYVDLVITNASQGMKRNDLIVFQYEQDAATLVESGKFVVIQGEEVSGTAADPTLTQNDLLTNTAIFDQMALWRVPVSGATISAPVQLFTVSKNLSNVGDNDAILPISKGGTGATTAAAALKNLGGVSASEEYEVVSGSIKDQNNQSVTFYYDLYKRHGIGFLRIQFLNSGSASYNRFSFDISGLGIEVAPLVQFSLYALVNNVYSVVTCGRFTTSSDGDTPLLSVETWEGVSSGTGGSVFASVVVPLKI